MMTQQQTFQTGDAPIVIIEHCSGNLTVRAWNQPILEVRAEGSDLSVIQDENEFRCKLYGSGIVRLPTRAQLQIEEAHGDVKLSDVQGETTIESVGGNCRIRQTGPASLHHVGGDLSAQTISGPFHFENVGGNLRTRQVAGDVSSTNVGGDVALSEVEGALRLANCGGNLTLRQIDGAVNIGHAGGDLSVENIHGDMAVHAGGNLSLGRVNGNVNARAGGDASVWLWLETAQDCNVHADGNLVCRIPSSAGATVHLHSGGRTVIRHLDVDVDSGENSSSFVLGDGESALDLSAGGDLTLLGRDPSRQDAPFEFEFDFGRDFAEQIAATIEVQMEQVAQQLDEKLSHLGDSDEIATRVHDRVQSAMHKAEEKIARALQYAEKRINAAERKAEKRQGRSRRRYGRNYSSHPPTPPTPPQPSRPPRSPGPTVTPATDEERMMILRMVEQGKISIEQAESLLSALEE